MDFESFLSDPSSFVHSLAQNETTEQDLGMRMFLDSHFEENPEDFEKIPIVSTLEDLQKTIPGQVVRLRCSLLEYSAHEMFPFRFNVNGEFHTCLFEQTMPEGAGYVSPDAMADRECFTAMSIRPMTDWFRQETAVKTERKGVKVITEKKHVKKSVANTPFEVTVKVAFQYNNDSNFDLIDFVGAFVEDLNTEDLVTKDVFSKSLPTFIAFTYKPTKLTGQIQETTDINEMHELVYQTIASIFEPCQAKVFFMWLLSNVEYFIGQTPIGGFNLNFTGATHEEAETVDLLLSNILPLYQQITISKDVLNSRNMKPSITVFGAEEQSPLLCSEGTKYLIDETLFDGELNQVGTDNLNLIKSSIYSNQINADFYGAEYTFYMFNTVLSLSSEASQLSNHISMNIGTVSQIPEISEEQLKVIRTYLEMVKETKFDISKTNQKFLQQRLINFKKSHGSISQEKLQILVLFMQNIAKSLGKEVISEEICAEAEEIMASCIVE